MTTLKARNLSLRDVHRLLGIQLYIEDEDTYITGRSGFESHLQAVDF